DAARKDVEDGWKRHKARELAEEAAKAIQKEIREKGIKDLALLRDFAAQHKIEPVELKPLAKAMKHPSFQPNMPPTYMPPTIEPDKVAYPARDMVNQIVDMRDKPIGEAIVVPDQPKEHFYVSVLTGRDEPSDSEFQQAFSNPLGGDLIMRNMDYERRTKYRKDFGAQLRSDAKVSITNPDEMKRFESGSAGSEE